jgi:predicted ArsR family transcriptional regulator
MTHKEEILNELKNNAQTIKELHNRLEISEPIIRTVINRLKNEKKIDLMGKKGRSKIYGIKPEQQKNHYIDKLKFLMDFFEKNTEILQEKNTEFFLENEQKFIEIANIIEGEK